MHGVADLGELLHERDELAVADDEQVRQTLGADGRGPHVAVEERDLAEEVAAVELRNLPAVLVDRDVAVEDDEEFVPDVALCGEDLVEPDLDLIRELADPLELSAVELREERDAAQMVELLVGGHGQQCTDPSKGPARPADREMLVMPRNP